MVILQRFAYSPMGTFGVLTVRKPLIENEYIDRISDPVSQWYTVERPWLLNERNVSCIPEGQYPLFPRRYTRGNYDAYEIGSVPNRSAILIHVGNTIKDVQGCICPGIGLGIVSGLWAVKQSSIAFSQFMNAMGGLETTIDIFFRPLSKGIETDG